LGNSDELRHFCRNDPTDIAIPPRAAQPPNGRRNPGKKASRNRIVHLGDWVNKENGAKKLQAAAALARAEAGEASEEQTALAARATTAEGALAAALARATEAEAGEAAAVARAVEAEGLLEPRAGAKGCDGRSDRELETN